MHLAGPLAFGVAGRRYAVATSGDSPPIDLDSSSAESLVGAASERSASEHEEDSVAGSPELPEQVQAAQGRLDQRRARGRGSEFGDGKWTEKSHPTFAAWRIGETPKKHGTTTTAAPGEDDRTEITSTTAPTGSKGRARPTNPVSLALLSAIF